MMKLIFRSLTFILFVRIVFVFLVPSLAFADSVTQDLLDKLKEKGILSTEEYQKFSLRAKEEEKRAAQTLQTGWVDRPFIRTKDKSFELKFGTRIQEDFRIYQKNDQDKNSGFRLRRAYLEFKGKVLNDWLFTFITSFGSNSSKVLYAHMDYVALPWLNVRMGQYKEPFGMEELTSDKWLDLVERAMITRATTPEYDIGIMLYGKVLDDYLKYYLGWFNGNGTGASGDNNDDKDVAGRLEYKPFKHKNGILKDLQIGFNVTAGDQSRHQMKAIRDPSMHDILPRINADGFRYRLGGDALWIYGPASLKGEYIYTRTERANNLSDVEVSGFYVGGTYLFTGEKKIHSRGIKPKSNFDLKDGGWGALELALRYEQMHVDGIGGKGYSIAPGEGFEAADNIIGNKVNAIEIGLNWYLNPFIRFAVAYSHAMYDNTGPALSHHVGSLYKNNYDFVVGRFQFAF